MNLSMSSVKKVVLAGLAGLALVLLLLWQGLPRLLQSQAERFVAEKTGHRLVMDRPTFDPFQLALRIGKLQLSDPQGTPLAGFDSLLIDISGASIPRRALVFDAIRIDGLSASLVEQADGQLNWTPLLDALKGKDDKPAESNGLPRLDIRSFILAGGQFDYADRRRTSAGFSTRIAPVDLELSDLSTLPDDAGQYRIAASTTLGARITLAGQVDLAPLMVAGTLRLEGLQLARLGPYVETLLPVAPEGVFEMSANFQAGNGGAQLDATIDQLQARLSGLRVVLKAAGPALGIETLDLRDGRYQLSGQTLSFAGVDLAGGRLSLPGMPHPPQFDALRVEDIQVALTEKHASVGTLQLVGARLKVVHRADGRIDLQEALQSLAGEKSAASPAAPAGESSQPWRYRIGKVDIVDAGLLLQEAAVNPPLELAIDKLAAQTEGVGNDLSQPLPVRLAFDVRSGGRFESEGKVVPASVSANVGFKLADLSLKPLQPLLAARTTLTLADGKFSTQGRATMDSLGPNVKGEFTVRDLRLMEPGSSKPVLAWKTLGSRDLRLTGQQLDLGELRLNGLDTQLLIDKERNLNFKKLIKPSATEPAAVASKAAPAATPAPTASAPASAFLVNIDRLRFNQGEMDFADQSLILPFGTRIHQLRGSIAGLSNRPGAIGQIELDGAVDDYGMARAVGSVELGNPTNGLDLRVQFRNVEMTNLTPYTAHFAGRKIDSGKLSLDLQYKIRQRQLQGENQVIMDRLTLGERVDSPSAKDLPLDLALAILRDADGRIDLGLPVAGSLDDPTFSYGSIIWKAITNVLTKIVTAPFRALGALFGGGGESLENIVFEAGAAQLTPPEREKLVRLAEAMGKRPALVLAVGGVTLEADRVALQEVQLRRQVLLLAGQRVPERGDPGPLSTQQPKIREVLENLYKERVGAADLAALKEGFRTANPGQLEESMAGKLVSRLSGLMREKKTLNEGEVASLKGTDFPAVLFERLRARENVADDRLQALGQARGEHAAELLRAAGVAAGRLRLLPAERDATDQPPREAALRLSLEAAPAVSQ